MALSGELRAGLLQYAVLGGGLVVALAAVASIVVGYRLGNVVLVVGLVGFIVGPLLFATSDTGLDAAAGGGRVGFQNITDPWQYQPEHVHVPGRVEVGLVLLGAGAWSALVLVVLLA